MGVFKIFKHKKMTIFFFLVSAIFLHYETIYALDFYNDKEEKYIIITASMDILLNTNINKECEDKGIIFRYIYDKEQIKDIENVITENAIGKIIYICSEVEDKTDLIEFITKNIDNKIKMDIFRVYDYDMISELLSRYSIEEDNDEISINVVNRYEGARYYIYKQPNRNSETIGYIYGDLTEVKILEQEKEFYKVETVRYSDKKVVIGYIPVKDIKQRDLNSRYDIIVSIEDQIISIFYDNQLIREIVCSTGKEWYDTPKGRFLIGKRGHSFGSSTYTCYNWVRFNNNFLFHSVLFNKDGTINEWEYRKLGTPASHGCIRMPLDDSKWFYDNITEGTLVTIK